MKKNQFNNFLKNLLAMGILILLTSCVEVIYEDPDYVDFSVDEPSPQTTEESTQPTDKTNNDDPFVEQGDFRLYYDPSIENYVDDAGNVVPAESGDEVYTAAHPVFADFNFSPMQAHIFVASVAEYEKAADFAPAIIADLSRLIEGASVFDGCVPELPLNVFYQDCGHQQFVSNPARVKFGNGSGIRFVSTYSIQDLAPVGNDNLVYVFQGFTEDGKYYLKVIVELMHSQLDGVGEIPSEVYTAQDAETVDAYFEQFSEILNSSEDEFTPKLEWIDSIIENLRVG